MRRSVTASFALTTTHGASRHAFQVAVARRPGIGVVDSFSAVLDGRELPVQVEHVPHDGVLHVVDLPDDTPDGAPLTVYYQASVTQEAADAPPVTTAELLEYLRPSRYAESDHLAGTAQSEFGALAGLDLARAVTSWVHERVAYVPGASRYTDGAVETFLARAGVCRDFAHLVVAFLRARDVPARIVCVYAPGLDPMDLHAVAEAWVDGAWHVLDATCLAPRPALLRVATGRDAADIAFLSSYGAPARLDTMSVLAVADDGLPPDDGVEPVRLA